MTIGYAIRLRVPFSLTNKLAAMCVRFHRMAGKPLPDGYPEWLHEPDEEVGR